MTSTIDNEKAFVRQAIGLYGAGYADHLRTKGFSTEWFLHSWAAVTDIINRHHLGPAFLDLGCGAGWSSIFLAGRGFKVTAGDVSADMLALARENAARLRLPIDFLEINMQAPFPVTPGQFDAILIFDALHHCPDERPVLQHCFQALRPGGSVLLVEPDWFHQYSPASRHDREHFGTTERGLGYGRLKCSLRAAGFVKPRRFYAVSATSRAALWQRVKALAGAVLTLTVGYPHHPVIALAEKP